MHEQLITYPEACARLHCSRTTLWKFSRDGLLPEPIKIGRGRRFRAAEIDALIPRLAEQAAADGNPAIPGKTDAAPTA